LCFFWSINSASPPHKAGLRGMWPASFLARGCESAGPHVLRTFFPYMLKAVEQPPPGDACSVHSTHQLASVPVLPRPGKSPATGGSNENLGAATLELHYASAVTAATKIPGPTSTHRWRAHQSPAGLNCRTAQGPSSANAPPVQPSCSNAERILTHQPRARRPVMGKI